MRRTCATAVLLSVLVADTASAQIINIQSALATEAPAGFSGSLTGAIDWRDGNIERFSMTGAPVARYRQGRHLVVGISSGNYATNANGRYIAKTLEHFRYRYSALDWLLAESFVQHSYDQFRRLKIRALAGAGLASTPVKTKELKLTIGVSYMLEVEQLRDDSEIDAGEDEIFHRASSYVLLAYHPVDTLQIVQTVYAQPRFDAARDFRILSESQIAIPLTPRLSHATSFIIAYDSRPPAAVEKRDLTLLSSLSLSF